MQETNADMCAVVNLKKQNYSHLEIKLYNEQVGFVKQAKIEIFHPQSKQSVLARENPQEGVYEAMLEPGDYSLQITKKDFKDF